MQLESEACEISSFSLTTSSFEAPSVCDYSHEKHPLQIYKGAGGEQ